MKYYFSRLCVAVLAFACLSLSLAVSAQSLNDTLSAAWGNDPSLQSAAANRVAAKENIEIAKSRLLPQANIQGSQANLSQTTTQQTSLGPQASPFRGSSYNYTFSVRQGILRPRDWVGLDLGRQQAFYGELKFQSAKSDLWNRASSAWLDLVAAQTNKLLYSNAISTIAESAKQETLRFEKGDGTKDSMIEAQAQLKQAKAMLLDAELNLSSKLKAFQVLTQLDQSDWMDRHLPDESKVKFSAFDKDALWERVLEETPELLAAQAVERINQIKAQQSRFDNYPTLDAFGQSTNAQSDTTNTLGYQYRNNQVGVQLSVPLYAGGGLEATKRQAVASYEASVADREALSVRIENQFDGDWASQAGLLEKATAARGLVMAALEQKRAAEFGVKKGLRTWTDVSNAELLLARRSSDLNSILLTLYKTQSRILSLLPTDDPAWDEWVRQVDLASLD
jgi:outer membrane protein, protease secretion system